MEQEVAEKPTRKVKGRGAGEAVGADRYAGDAGVFESIDGGSGPGPQRCDKTTQILFSCHVCFFSFCSSVVFSPNVS